MYTIKRAAELTGVPEATLRAWERRYGLVSPERTEAGYRVYSDADLETVRSVVELVERGVTPSLAAREVRQAHEGQALASVPAAAVGDATAPAGARPPAGTPFAPEHDGTDATARLLDAAADIDPDAVAAVLDEQFATASFEHVVDGWLMPALVEVGEAWASRRVSVAGEHLVAHAVHRRLAAAFDAARSRGDGPRVLVGLPAGVHHELGLFAFSVALRRAGLDVVHLGADVPLDAWRAAVDAHDARAVVTAAPTRADVAAARSLVRALARSHPEVTVAVGGSEQEAVGGRGVRHLGHRIGEGAAELSGTFR